MEVRFKKSDVSKSYPYLYEEAEKKISIGHHVSLAAQKCTAEKIEEDENLFDAVTWVDDPTYLVVHSYGRHVTHFMEPISSINAATNRLSKTQLYGSSQNDNEVSIQLLNHASAYSTGKKVQYMLLLNQKGWI